MPSAIVAPPTFQARVELPDRIEHTDILAAYAQGLLAQLAGWLTARQLAITAWCTGTGRSTNIGSATTVEAFWDNLCAGRDSVSRFAADELDAGIPDAQRADRLLASASALRSASSVACVDKTAASNADRCAVASATRLSVL